MRPDQHDRLLAAMRELAQTASRLPTVLVVDACRQILECDASTATERYGLQSPFRQVFYLFAMMATATEPPSATTLGKKQFDSAWKRAIKLVTEIFDVYAQMYWPATREEWSKRDDQVHERDGIALRAFLHQHNTGVLASPEQVLQRVCAVLEPFEVELEALVGLSGSRAAAIAEWITTSVQEELDRFVEVIRRSKEVYDRGIADGLTGDALFERARGDPVLEGLRRDRPGPSHPFGVRRSALAARFGGESAAAFWRLFVTARGSVALPLYLDQPNPVESAPLLAVDEDEALLPISNPLSTAIWRRLTEALSEGGHKDRFTRRRAKVHEANVARVIQGFLPADARQWRSVYERADANDEHDLVVVLGRDVILLEAKATPLDPVFRDPGRAVTRLRHQFRADEGIQSAFNQASRVRRRLLNDGQDVPLYDRKGNLLHTLRPGDVDEVYCVCVTADEYGVLATDLSIFLERNSGEPYPWAVNAYDLETFFDAIRFRGWDASKWLQYLRERRQLHGRVHASDELEVAGVFIRNGSLEPLLAAEGDLIVLGADMSNVFDEIFIERRGGPAAKLDPQGPLVFTDLRAALGLRERSTKRLTVTETARYGLARKGTGPAVEVKEPVSGGVMSGAARNQRCHCGSGKKFKKCHGAPNKSSAGPT